MIAASCYLLNIVKYKKNSLLIVPDEPASSFILLFLVLYYPHICYLWIHRYQKNVAKYLRYRRLTSQAKTLLNSGSEDSVSDLEYQVLMNGLREYRDSSFICCGNYNYDYWRPCLTAYWETLIYPSEFINKERGRVEEQDKLLGMIYQRVPEYNWTIGFSKDFLKAIKKIDRKIQGHILKALTQIADEPCDVKGDTVKPLTRDKKGLWRYRLGGFRLIYLPNEKSHQVIIISFNSRAQVYDKDYCPGD